jgi:hypothetical protein
MLQLHNWLPYVVTSNNFVTFERAVTSNCRGGITVKMGNKIKIVNHFYYIKDAT